MIPDPDLQLSVVIKALSDVVAPALDPSNGVAAEQLHLAVATLSMLRERLPLLHAVARQELINALSIASEVDGGSEIEKMIIEGNALLEDPAAKATTLDSMRERLLGAISEMVGHTHDANRMGELTRAVIAASKSQCDLARSYSISAGFEPNPDVVPSLESLL